MTTDNKPSMSPLRRMMVGAMNRLMLSCAEASRLTSESLDRNLSASEKMRLNMHTAMCRWCKRNRRQFELIREIIHRHEHTPPTEEESLSVEARTKIDEAVRKHRDLS